MATPQTRRRQPRSDYAVLLVGLDLILSTVCFFAAHALRHALSAELGGVYRVMSLLWVVPLGSVAWVSALALADLYHDLERRAPGTIIGRIMAAAALVAGVLSLGVLMARADEFSRVVFVFYLVLTSATLCAERLLWRRLVGPMGHGGGLKTALLVGNGPLAAKVRAELDDELASGYRVVGAVDAVRLQSSPGELARALDQGGIDEVIFALERQEIALVNPCLQVCEEVGVEAQVVLDLFDTTANARARLLAGLPVICLDTKVYSRPALLAKRALDVLLAAVTLVLALPLLAICALVIRATSPGPAIFRQRRVGLSGRSFDMYKLRTMRLGAEQGRDALQVRNESDGPAFKMRRDPRVTPIGFWLRRYSIDELPQLWNVIRGDMSLVGPRPPLPEEVARYQRWQRRRLSVRPGITCIWQISGRSDVKFDEWMRLDLRYIDSWSLWLDLRLLVLTVPSVLRRRGSY